MQAEQESKELLQKSLKLLEQENILLKHQIDKLEKSKPEKNANESGKISEFYSLYFYAQSTFLIVNDCAI